MAIALMKAVLTDERFSDPGWIFERKLDGIRCVAVKRDGEVSLRSRNDLSLDARFADVARALARDPVGDVVLDGEVVAFAGGKATFEALQQGSGQVVFSVFDVLSLDGEDLRELPLRERKARLRGALSWADPLRLVAYRNEAGEAMYTEACAKGWEGVIAKRADSMYTGARSKDWLKFKCSAEQELVIGGFTAPKGSRTDLGALLLGVHEGDALRYAGKVGTGFTQATLRDLAERLAPLGRDSSPFADAPRIRDATWVEPELVAQVGFSEWTTRGRLRHPRFLGLREDKTARDVVRERDA